MLYRDIDNLELHVSFAGIWTPRAGNDIWCRLACKQKRQKNQALVLAYARDTRSQGLFWRMLSLCQEVIGLWPQNLLVRSSSVVLKIVEDNLGVSIQPDQVGVPRLPIRPTGRFIRWDAYEAPLQASSTVLSRKIGLRSLPFPWSRIYGKVHEEGESNSGSEVHVDETKGHSSDIPYWRLWQCQKGFI